MNKYIGTGTGGTEVKSEYVEQTSQDLLKARTRKTSQKVFNGNQLSGPVNICIFRIRPHPVRSYLGIFVAKL
jgi:hypothetical protein